MTHLRPASPEIDLRSFLWAASEDDPPSSASPDRPSATFEDVWGDEEWEEGDEWGENGDWEEDEWDEGEDDDEDWDDGEDWDDEEEWEEDEEWDEGDWDEEIGPDSSAPRSAGR